MSPSISHWFSRTARLRSEGPSRPFLEQTSAFRHAAVVVLCYYVYQLSKLDPVIWDWEHVRGLQFVDPVWIIRLLSPLSAARVVDLCNLAFTVGTVAGVLFFRRRAARVAFFAGLLLQIALRNSFGKIDHGGHMNLFLSFTLIFLPDGRGLGRAERQKYLTIFVAAQGVILLCYSLAGLWKVAAALEPLPEKVVSLFSFGAFPSQIAGSLIEKQTTSAAGLFLIDYPVIAWIVGLMGVYFEFFAFAAILRPRLHAAFGVALVFLHLGAILIMRIPFVENIFFLALFLVASPFAPRFDLAKTGVALPPMGWIVGRRSRRERSIETMAKA